VLCIASHITKTYPSPTRIAPIIVLNDISLAIDAGESLAIVGPSGSGKTTLLNIIASLDRPDKGTVRIDGRDICGLPEKELARLRNSTIGVVFQKHYLLPQCTLLQNVLIPTLPWPAGKNRKEIAERADRLLERVGLSNRKHHLPGQLSGGECQRAAVVRALINGPRLLCADEPTGSLDRTSSDALGELLVELNKEEQTALLVVTHATALAGRMDLQLELRDGTYTRIR
jgi:lipoprotein-releasing system ATP-binding protein